MTRYGWDDLVKLLAKAFSLGSERCTHRHTLILMVEDYHDAEGRLVRSRYWTVYLGDLNRIKAALRDIARKENLLREEVKA